MHRRWTVIGTGMLVVAVAIGAAFALKRGGGQGEAARTVSAVTLQFRADEVVTPRRVAMPEVVEFSGPLVAPGTAVLRAKAGGTLLVLSVAEGDRVRAGQPVGRIDLAELVSRAAERSALLDGARATLDQAERTHGSNERLAAQQFISPSALDASRAAVDSARASLQAAQAALDTTRVAQREAQLLAPIAGIVHKRHVLPGEKVAPEQPVITVVDLRQLELAGTVVTHEVARLAPGIVVDVRVEGVDRPVAARLARIAPAAEAGTRSIGVTVTLPNGDERLRAGQYALARVTLPDPQERLTLPLAAVGSTAGQPQVWVLVDGRLQRRAVTLGRRDEAAGRVEVLTGLSPDTPVLAARFDNLREGAAASVAAPLPGGGSSGNSGGSSGSGGANGAAALAAAAASAPAVR
jgi:membrane fusion protein (multidrug efflux system)